MNQAGSYIIRISLIIYCLIMILLSCFVKLIDLSNFLVLIELLFYLSVEDPYTSDSFLLNLIHWYLIHINGCLVNVHAVK